LAAPPECSSGRSNKAHSVVGLIPATEAAFLRAILVTFLGSFTPDLLYRHGY